MELLALSLFDDKNRIILLNNLIELLFLMFEMKLFSKKMIPKPFLQL